MKKFWIGVIAMLALMDVTGGTYLWWLLDKKQTHASSTATHSRVGDSKRL